MWEIITFVECCIKDVYKKIIYWLKPIMKVILSKEKSSFRTGWRHADTITFTLQQLTNIELNCGTHILFMDYVKVSDMVHRAVLSQILLKGIPVSLVMLLETHMSFQN